VDFIKDMKVQILTLW